MHSSFSLNKNGKSIAGFSFSLANIVVWRMIKLQKKKEQIGIPLWLVFFIAILIMLIPLLVAVFMKFPIFGVFVGSADGWLSYWGGYLGAFLGLTAVVITTSFMIGEQRKNHAEQMKVQIESIELNNKANQKREMKQFYLTNQLSKIEEIIEINNRLMSSNVSLNNDLVRFSVFKEAIENGDLVERKDEFDSTIRELRENFYILHGDVTNSLYRFTVLLNYLPVATKDYMEIHNSFTKLLDEIKHCYYSEDAYKKYTNLHEQETYVSSNGVLIHEQLNSFNFYYLQNELKTIIEEIVKYAKD